MATTNAPWQISAWLFVAALICACVTVALAFKNTSRALPRLLAIALLGFVMVITVWAANALIKVPIEINETSGTAFTNALKATSEKPDYVWLSCPTTNESACALAEQFIPALQRAGWKVYGPHVDRVTLGVHSTEIVIADYGPPLVDPQNPDLGVWTKLMPWRMQEVYAFNQLGINPIASLNDPELPQNQTRIYIGTVPKKSLVAVVRGWFS